MKRGVCAECIRELGSVGLESAHRDGKERTMKAIRMHERGGPEQLAYEEAPRPAIEPGDALVRVQATGITPTELSWSSNVTTRDGKDRLPVVPAYELSGVVEELAPDVKDVTIGEAVYGLTDFWRDGAAAERCLVRGAKRRVLNGGDEHDDGAEVCWRDSLARHRRTGHLGRGLRHDVRSKADDADRSARSASSQHEGLGPRRHLGRRVQVPFGAELEELPDDRGHCGNHWNE